MGLHLRASLAGRESVSTERAYGRTLPAKSRPSHPSPLHFGGRGLPSPRRADLGGPGSHSCSSAGKREKSSVIGALSDRRVACATSPITGHSTRCPGLSMLALPRHWAPMVPAHCSCSRCADVNGR
jgi:hypothetical protein